MATEYVNHHWRNAKNSWAKMPGSPEEVAQQLISRWNDPMQFVEDSDQLYRPYPKTAEFVRALANLITAVRMNAKVTLLPDGPDGPPDALCLARGGCGKKPYR